MRSFTSAIRLLYVGLTSRPFPEPDLRFELVVEEANGSDNARLIVKDFDAESGDARIILELDAVDRFRSDKNKWDHFLFAFQRIGLEGERELQCREISNGAVSLITST